MRASPSGSIASSSSPVASGTSRRRPEHQPLARPLGRGQLLDRPGRRLASLERVDEAGQRGPVGAPLEPERRDGADADAEVVAARPVGQVVARAQVVAAEVGRLVPAVARRGQTRDDVLVVILQQLGLPRQLGAVPVREARARLGLELVAGEVLGLERERLVEIAVELGAPHAGHAEEQVEREVGDARGAQARGRCAHLIGRRPPLEHRQLRRPERLRTERDAHAALRQHRRELVVDGLGIGLDGQLRGALAARPAGGRAARRRAASACRRPGRPSRARARAAPAPAPARRARRRRSARAGRRGP